MRNSYISKINQYVDDITSYISNIADNIDIDLSAYVTKNELNAMSYITANDLNGYATESYVGSYVVNNTVHIVNITQNEYDALSNEEKNDITKIYNIIDAQNVDISALVSKTELSGMSYATTSYVTENYFQNSGGDISGNISLTNDIAYLYTQPINIRFQKDGGNEDFEFIFKHNNYGISTASFGNDGKGWIEQWQIFALNNKVKIDYFTYTYFKGDIFAKGIGGFDGTNQNNAYTIAYVINEIQTTLGSAASVAEIIVGNNS